MKNTITYERLMDAIYHEMLNDEPDKNVIETKELRKKYDDFEEKYLNPLHNMSRELYVDIWETMLDIVFGYCRSGFDAGFKAAVALFETKQNCNLG